VAAPGLGHRVACQAGVPDRRQARLAVGLSCPPPAVCYCLPGDRSVRVVRGIAQRVEHHSRLLEWRGNCRPVRRRRSTAPARRPPPCRSHFVGICGKVRLVARSIESTALKKRPHGERYGPRIQSPHLLGKVRNSSRTVTRAIAGTRPQRHQYQQRHDHRARQYDTFTNERKPQRQVMISSASPATPARAPANNANWTG